MNKMWEFFTQMDKQGRRALAVMALMFGLVIVILMVGRDMLSLPETEIYKFFQSVEASGWGLPATILSFVLAAFLGAPQWALIAGVVLAFGPYTGSVYAWVATMVSASLNFWLGRWMGAERLARYGGELVNRIIGIVRNNGFLTSFAVRFVPTGPFVLVNMAAGVSRMTFAAFAAGTGLGIIPKIAIVGLVARGLMSGSEGKSFFNAFIIFAITLVAFMFLARRFLKRRLEMDH